MTSSWKQTGDVARAPEVPADDALSSCTVSEDDSTKQKPFREEHKLHRYCCYLLVSDSEERGAHNRTYVGFTTNPWRRLRQHNGELKGAGAHRTRAFRPWRMILFVEGFRSDVQALQFEWQWQHPRKSRALRRAAEENARSGRVVQPYGVAGRLDVLARLLTIRPWSCLPLRLVLPIQQSKDGVAKPQIISEGWLASLPSQLRILRGFSLIEALAISPDGVGALESRHAWSYVCCICEMSDEIQVENADTCFQRAIGYCLNCAAPFHVQCLARYNNSSCLLPERVYCQRCRQAVLWADVLRTVDRSIRTALCQ
jgi:structure-specific endonuclease subunit SLX1